LSWICGADLLFYFAAFNTRLPNLPLRNYTKSNTSKVLHNVKVIWQSHFLFIAHTLTKTTL